MARGGRRCICACMRRRVRRRERKTDMYGGGYHTVPHMPHMPHMPRWDAAQGGRLGMRHARATPASPAAPCPLPSGCILAPTARPISTCGSWAPRRSARRCSPCLRLCRRALCPLRIHICRRRLRFAWQSVRCGDVDCGSSGTDELRGSAVLQLLRRPEVKAYITINDPTACHHVSPTSSARAIMRFNPPALVQQR